jgi:hypothetical protein
LAFQTLFACQIFNGTENENALNFGARDTLTSASILLLRRNDPSYAATRLFDVTLAPRDQMHVAVENGLSSVCAGVDAACPSSEHLAQCAA